MDLPRPSLVKQLALHLSPEGRGFAYLLADHAGGGVLRLTRAAAQSFARFSRAAMGDGAARSALSEDDAKIGFMTLQMSAQARRAAEQGPKHFNPLSLHLELFDMGPWQKHLAQLSPLVFGKIGAALLAALAVLAISMGIRNEWSAATAFQTSITLEALLTFGLVAPFLKLIHELGHVMAATRANVTVRQAGLNLIAFYPMPFVDCSAADLTAQRGERILISAAGVLTDITIGLLAFCLWHITENSQTRDILGYVFVFSTLNSLLFNANPLMRMDGYFALSDALGRRNLATDAAALQKQFIAHVKSLGAGGARPHAPAEWAMLAYGLVATVYRVAVLFGIAWVTMPQFFGLGLLATAWAAWAMFGARLFAPAAPALPDAAAGAGRRSLHKWGVILALLGGVLLLPLSPRIVIELRPDLQNHYNITNPRAGVLLDDLPRNGAVASGAVLARLASRDSDDALALAHLGLSEAKIMEAISLGNGAAQIKAGADRVANAAVLLGIATTENAALTLTAPQAGTFTAAAPLGAGAYLAQGSIIGAVLPQSGPIYYAGSFPEAYVIHYDKGVKSAQLWAQGTYRRLEATDIRLVEEAVRDNETMGRGFAISVRAQSTNLLNYPQVKLRFQPIAIWRHVALWANRKLAQFRDAQLAETERRIEN